MFDSSGKDQMPQKIAQVIGQNKQTQPHLIRDKMLAGQSRPVQGILVFLDPLLGLEWVLAISGVVLKAFWGGTVPKAFDVPVSNHELACLDRRKTAVTQYADVGSVLAVDRRHRLHGGCGLLCG